MDESHTYMIAAGLCLILLAVISGTIAAVSHVRLGIMKKLSEENNKKAGVIFNILEREKENILISLWGSHSLLILILAALAVFWSGKFFAAIPCGVYYVLAVVFAAAMILAEIPPRTLTASNPETSCIILGPVIKINNAICVPIIKVINWIFSPMFSRFQKPNQETIQLTEEEIKRVVEQGQEMGVIEEEEKDMINSIFIFGETIAREVMVPRVDMICADSRTPVSEIRKIISQSGFSRIPVYEESIDRIQGVVYAKDLLGDIDCELDAPAFDFARKPPYFVPDAKKIDELLREMRQRSISIAIVVDEYGGTDGLITIEDIIEEIVGEITDEHDRETPDIVKIEDGKYLVDGSTVIEDVNSELNVNITSDEQETIGGVIYGILGHIPAQGEKVEIPEQGLEILVKQVDGQRITSLLVEKTNPQET